MILLSALVAGCKASPEAIPYGNAECAYCRMNVVDRQHAAELVTDKGKVIFFDAIECMIKYMASKNDVSYAHKLVNDYTKPGELIPASDALFLISKQIPSPMGAYLSAFSSMELAEQTLLKSGGKIYSWEEIIDLDRSGEL